MNFFNWLLSCLFSRKSPSVSTRATTSSDTLPNNEVLAECGHMTLLKGSFHVWGKTSEGEMRPHEDGKIYHCIKCIESMTIPCAWCGELIFPGDPITLYTPLAEDFKPKEGVVVYSRNPLQVVGCLRWDCAQTGADRAGFWEAPGHVKRMMSPIEACMLSGGVVTVPDLGEKDTFITINHDQ